MTPIRRLLAVLLATVALVGAAFPAATAAAGDDTAAVAVNTKDGTSVVRVAFAIVRVMNGDVDQSNAAVAYASCESCQAVAISIQVVLVMTDPDVVTPTNLALAINDQCTACQTLASAYQFVFGNGEPVRLSPEGEKRIAQIRRDFQELRRSDLSIVDIQARTDELANQLREVLRTELVPARPPQTQEQPEPQQPAEPEPEPEQPQTQTTPSETQTETTPDETQTETAPDETQTETTPDETQTETTPDDTETTPTTPDDGTSPPP
jgi:putative peptide zinc metalloprotease protein